MSKRQLNKTALAIMIALGVIHPLYAQQSNEAEVTSPAQGEGSAKLERIEVTSQKRAQSLQEVPIGISAFGADDIARLNADDLSDLQYATPNLTVSTNNRSNARIGIRGVSDFSRNPGYDNRVSVYVDGIYVGRSAASNQSTLDLQRIEVLRGPQGTLFGKNTVAGAINITTKRPQEEFSASVEGTLGNFSHRELTARVNGALIDDTLYAKLTVNNTNRDGYVTNLFDGSKLNGLDNQALRLQLRWMLDNTEININADYDEQNAEFHGREPINDAAAPNLFEVSFNKGSLQYVELQGLSAIIEHQLANGLQLDSLTGLRKTTFQNSADEDYTAVAWQPGISPFADTESAIGEESDQLSQEFRLLSPAYDKFDYVVGLYYFDQTNDATTSAGVGNNIATVRVPASVDTTSFAAYLHGNYWLTQRMQFTGGLRYTNEEKSIDFEIVDTTGTFTNGTLTDDRKVSDLSPKVGLNFFANDDLMVYANYARGFKSGGWNADFVESLQGLGFADEQVDSAELGVKSSLLQERLRLNVAVYQSDYSDFQVQQFVELPDGTTDIILTNAGEVTAQGLELDINFAANDAVTLWTTYGYTDATFERFKNGGGDGIDFDGNKLPDAPTHSFNVGIQGYFPLFDNASLVTQLDYSYRDDFYTNPNNAENTKVDSYTLLNARVGIEANSGVWSLYLWSRNVADSDEPTYKSRSFLGIPRAVYMEPRMVGVTFTYRFGDI